MARGPNKPKQPHLTIKNPKTSVIGPSLPQDVKTYHLFRSKQVLVAYQDTGRFPETDFETFVGKRGLNKTGTRRDINSIRPYYVPFPGAIRFIAAQSFEIVIDAYQYVLQQFNMLAPPPSNSPRKGHPFAYKTSLIGYIAGHLENAEDVVGLLNANQNYRRPETIVGAINYAPHAATIERDRRIMYKIARATARKFGSGLVVQYTYVLSSSLGFRYGRGTGGPGPETAKRTQRSYPVIYALPVILLQLSRPGAPNSSFDMPGKNQRRRAREARKLAMRS